MIFGRKKSGGGKSVKSDPKAGVRRSLMTAIVMILLMGALVFVGARKVSFVIVDIRASGQAYEVLSEMESRTSAWSDHDTLIAGIESYISRIKYAAKSTLREDFSRDLELTGLRTTNMTARNLDGDLVEVSIEGVVEQKDLLSMLEKMGRMQKIWYVKNFSVRPRTDVAVQLASYSGKTLSGSVLEEFRKAADPGLVLSVKMEIVTAAD